MARVEEFYRLQRRLSSSHRAQTAAMASGLAARGRGFEIHWKLEGAEDLERALRELPRRLQKTPVRNAMKRALQPTLAAAREEVPKGGTGNLADSLTITTKLNPNQKRGHIRYGDTIEMFVGSDAPHAHLVEFGTVERFRGTSKKSRIRRAARGDLAVHSGSTGKMPRNSFLTRAWDRTRAEVKQTFGKLLGEEIRKAVKRYQRRLARGTSAGQKR